jgi:CheY-like chemotaxis protein
MPHKLLLADDSVTIQRVIELTFADEDIQVIAVGDGQQAMTRIEAERPDIVLADVGMPERDGYEVAAFVKSSAPLAHIPVLLLTGAFEPVDESRARAVGCDGVLVKPFEPQMVINRVKDLLAGRRQAPATPEPEAPAAPAPPAPASAASAPGTPASAESKSASPESLDEYFDRLDAAFASMGASADPTVIEPAAASAVDRRERTSPVQAGAGKADLAAELAGWEPTLGEEAAAAATPAAAAAAAAAPGAPSAGAVASPPAPAAPVEVAAVGAAPWPSPEAPAARAVAAPPIAAAAAVQAPPLAEAFAALLAAEQGHVTVPQAAAAPAPLSAASLTDDFVDEVVRRVTSRMSDQAVRETVLQVAERLVREEIERIKSQS